MKGRVKLYLSSLLIAGITGAYAQKDITNAGTKTFYVGANADVYSVGAFTLQASSILTFDASTQGTLTIAGNYTDNGATITKGVGRLLFKGTGDQTLTCGSTSFYNFEVDNSGGSIILGADLNVENTLTFTTGTIKLGTYNLTIGSSGSISGASSSKFIVTAGTGELRQEGLGATGRTGAILFPVGFSTSSYTPMTVTNTGTDDRFGVTLDDDVLTDGTSGSALTEKALDKTWLITEQTGGGSNVTLKFQWNTADELSSFDRTNCYISHYSGGSWAQEGTAGAATDEGGGVYSFSASGITSFSPFGMGSLFVLPVELTSFTGNCEGEQVTLNWETASEINNDFFTIQRSLDGEEFENVMEVDGHGNRETITEYEATDEDPHAGLTYYRLRQQDFDGTTDYSDIIAVGCDVEDLTIDRFYTSPSGPMQLWVNSKELATVSLEILSMDGKLFFQEAYQLEAGRELLTLDQMSLSPGIYFLRLSSPVHQNVVHKFRMD